MGKGKWLRVKCAQWKRWIMKNDAKVVIRSSGLILISTIAAHSIVFRNLNWGDPESWSHFGTYFSGIVTPVVALGSAWLFYRSIMIQKEEFRKTRNEMEAATRIQQQAEQSRLATTKQKQLERTIPIARECQVKIFKQFTDVVSELKGTVYDPIKEETTFRNFAPQNGVALTQEELERITAQIESYSVIGDDIASMIFEYIDYNGLVYTHLDLIVDLDIEADEIKAKLDELHMRVPDEFENYQRELQDIDQRFDKELNSYKAMRS